MKMATNVFLQFLFMLSNDIPSDIVVTLDISIGLTLTPVWMGNHIRYKVWNEITYPFLNFICCTIEVKDWINNINPHFTRQVITYPCWD